MLISISCLLMRGGTSKGPFFLASDLPRDIVQRDQILLGVLGSPDQTQIDGIGGGTTLTSKVMIINRSEREGIDVDCLFAQVSLTESVVDTKPNCGNLLAAVGAFAIERQLVHVSDPLTQVVVYNKNTNKVIEVVLQTPQGRITYDGDAHIDGVPGTGAPILLKFIDAAGAITGQLLPTGNPTDIIDGVTVSCIDFSVPMVLIAASSLGKTGYESKEALDNDQTLLARIEYLRRQAAIRMGLGDVSHSVIPKVALLASPCHGGDIHSRYFVPWSCHASHAVTGGSCLAAACCIPNTVAAQIYAITASGNKRTATHLTLEHPMGSMVIYIEHQGLNQQDMLGNISIGVIRTARPLFDGHVFVRT